MQLSNGVRYYASERGNDQTPILAMDEKGKYSLSVEKLGGQVMTDPTIKYVIEQYSIISIKDGVISIKKIKEISIDRNGDEKTKKLSGGWILFDNGSPYIKGLILVSIFALTALLLIFLIKIRKNKYIPIAR